MVAERYPMPPRFPSWPVLGSLIHVRNDPLGFYQEAARYGEFVELSFPERTGYLLGDPDHIKHVLVDAHEKFSKRTRGYDALRLVLGQGLVTAEGELWKRQRHIAQPAFHAKKIGAFVDRMAAATGQMLERWTKAEAVLDVDREMMALTLKIVGLCLLSTDLSHETDVIGKSVTVLLKEAMDRVTRLVWLPLSVPTTANRRLNAALAACDAVISEIVSARRRTKEHPTDLLSMLMEASAEMGQELSEKQLRDELVTIVAAGHETTANALSWTFHLLGENPEVRKRLAAEVEPFRGRPLVLADLERLTFTEACIKESMRLYPPVWSVARAVESEDAIGAFRVRPKSLVFMSPYVTHRNPRIWGKTAAEFRPERFLDGTVERLPKYAYFPFGGGPRICIGNGFAMMEAKIILAMVAGRFVLDRVPDHPIALEPLITLRPKHGLKMRLRRV